MALACTAARAALCGLLATVAMSSATIAGGEPAAGSAVARHGSETEPVAPGGPGVNVAQLFQPAQPGRMGPRQFTKSAFGAGHVAWVITCSLLGLLALPGWVRYYAGNSSSQPRASGPFNLGLLLSGLTVAWSLAGFSLAFAPSLGSADGPTPTEPRPGSEFTGAGIMGGLDYAVLRGFAPVGPGAERQFPVRRPDDRIPAILVFLYQTTGFLLAATPLALLLAGRLTPLRLSQAMMLWMFCVYAPLAHWILGFGWLRRLGVLDSGGGALLHAAAGVSALVAALLLNDRATSPPPSAERESRGQAVTGGLLAALGLLAMQGGSLLAATPAAGGAVVCALLAGCAGALGWAMVLHWRANAPQPADPLAGALAGMIGATSAAGLIAPQSALIVGFVCGAAACAAHMAAWCAARGTGGAIFAVQGLPGLLGLPMTALFASFDVAGVDDRAVPIDGLLSGDASRIGWQLLAVVVLGATAAAGTAGILAAVGGHRLRARVFARQTADQTRPASHHHPRAGFAMAELIVALAGLLVLAALVFPAIGQAREAARAQRCRDNLRQLGQALHAYHDAARRFPPEAVWAVRQSSTARWQPRHFTWVDLLLPYLGRQDLHDQMDLNAPLWGQLDQRGLQLVSVQLPELTCPSDGAARGAPWHGLSATNYAGAEGYDWRPRRHDPLGGIFTLNASTGLSQILDGASQTIAVGEVTTSGFKNGGHERCGTGMPRAGSESVFRAALLAVPVTDSQGSLGLGYPSPDGLNNPQPSWSWWRFAPAVYKPTYVHGFGINAEWPGASSWHPGGALFLMADGSVRFISQNVFYPGESRTGYTEGAGVWGALNTARGGEMTAEEPARADSEE